MDATQVHVGLKCSPLHAVTSANPVRSHWATPQRLFFCIVRITWGADMSARGGHGSLSRIRKDSHRFRGPLQHPLAQAELSRNREVWLGVLGPLVVRKDRSELVPLPSAQRVVLALLALADGSSVSADAIIETLWKGSPPVSAAGIVQTYVSRLRGVFAGGSPDGSTCLLRSAGGYRLELPGEEFDLRLFRAHLSETERAGDRGDTTRACEIYEQALALWRGEPLEDIEILHSHPAVIALSAERTRAVLGYAVAGSACGRHEKVLVRLRPLAAKNPFDEVVQALSLIHI